MIVKNNSSSTRLSRLWLLFDSSSGLPLPSSLALELSFNRLLSLITLGRIHSFGFLFFNHDPQPGCREVSAIHPGRVGCYPSHNHHLMDPESRKGGYSEAQEPKKSSPRTHSHCCEKEAQIENYQKNSNILISSASTRG